MIITQDNSIWPPYLRKDNVKGGSYFFFVCLSFVALTAVILTQVHCCNSYTPEFESSY